jgi:imidazolonepropionase
MPVTVRILADIGRLWNGTEVVSNAAILLRDDTIAWAGPRAALPSGIPGVIQRVADADQIDHLDGALVTPGLIDAHTHPVYAGNRWAELAMRTGGASLEEVVSAGGGLASSVTVTRGTDPWTLRTLVESRLRDWLRAGTTTIEAKTGYHLTRDGELADVRLLRSLAAGEGLPRVHVTFLAASAVPPEYRDHRDEYVAAVAAWCRDAAAAGADGVDVVCERGRFTADEARLILVAGQATGLTPRLHAGGDSGTGAARLAAELGCASADLLNGATDDDVAALAAAGVSAVVCPASGLDYGTAPPVRSLLDRGVPVALGSGHAPGMNGITSMALVVALAIENFGMSVPEALRAATGGAARALRLDGRGVACAGAAADLVAWDADHEGAFAWSYSLRPRRIWLGGEPVAG